jgi:hypothetical protein
VSPFGLPEKVFNEGLVPRGTSTDLLAHAMDSTNPPSGFTSTSMSSGVAGNFGPWVYSVRPIGGIDVNAVLGDLSPNADELEIAIPGGVLTQDIAGAQRFGSDIFIPNPNFVP